MSWKKKQTIYILTFYTIQIFLLQIFRFGFLTSNNDKQSGVSLHSLKIAFLQARFSMLQNGFKSSKIKRYMLWKSIVMVIYNLNKINSCLLNFNLNCVAIKCSGTGCLNVVIYSYYLFCYLYDLKKSVLC